MKLRHVLFGMHPASKKDPRYAEDESDVDDDFIDSWEAQTKAKEIEKAEKKFTKENEKLKEDGKSEQGADVLAQRIAAIDAEFERLEEERGTGTATLKRDRPLAKVEEGIEKLSEKIKAFKLQIIDRDEGKEVALGTRFAAIPCFKSKH